MSLADNTHPTGIDLYDWIDHTDGFSYWWDGKVLWCSVTDDESADLDASIGKTLFFGGCVTYVHTVSSVRVQIEIMSGGSENIDKILQESLSLDDKWRLHSIRRSLLEGGRFILEGEGDFNPAYAVWAVEPVDWPACFKPTQSTNKITAPIPNKTETKKTKETTMSNIILNTNLTAAKSAAFNEAGRLVNSQLSKLASKSLPMMVRGYADSPFGRVVLANGLTMAVSQFRPEDKRLNLLAEAALAAAYQEVYQLIDFGGILDELSANTNIRRAIGKVEPEVS